MNKDLLQDSIEIRDEVRRGANTSRRVGGLLVGMNENLNEIAVSVDELQSNVKQLATDKADLEIEIARFNDVLHFRIKSQVQDGYIVLLRKKRQNDLRHDFQKVGYIVKNFAFGKRADFEKSAVKASLITPGVWTEFPREFFDLVTQTTVKMNAQTDVPCFKFAGNTYAKKAIPTRAGGTTDTKTLSVGLQYIIVNPDYLDGIKVDGKIPTRLFSYGGMKHVKLYLRSRYKNSLYSYRIDVVPYD